VLPSTSTAGRNRTHMLNVQIAATCVCMLFLSAAPWAFATALNTHMARPAAVVHQVTIHTFVEVDADSPDLTPALYAPAKLMITTTASAPILRAQCESDRWPWDCHPVHRRVLPSGSDDSELS
jgi:hypothetical protein